jgi:GNAT superfamily N-acetyltransferase
MALAENKNPLQIDTDPRRLDFEFVHGFISNSYWAKGRSRATMQLCMAHAVNFGVYLNGRQIGYGRVVTDYGQFAYLLDFFIAEVHRGRGYAQALIAYVLSFPPLQEVKVWRLATEDAHRLYEKFGFRQLKNPEKMMELLK